MFPTFQSRSTNDEAFTIERLNSGRALRQPGRTKLEELPELLAAAVRRAKSEAYLQSLQLSQEHPIPTEISPTHHDDRVGALPHSSADASDQVSDRHSYAAVGPCDRRPPSGPSARGGTGGGSLAQRMSLLRDKRSLLVARLCDVPGLVARGPWQRRVSDERDDARKRVTAANFIKQCKRHAFELKRQIQEADVLICKAEEVGRRTGYCDAAAAVMDKLIHVYGLAVRCVESFLSSYWNGSLAGEGIVQFVQLINVFRHEVRRVSARVCLDNDGFFTSLERVVSELKPVLRSIHQRCCASESDGPAVKALVAPSSKAPLRCATVVNRGRGRRIVESCGGQMDPPVPSKSNDDSPYGQNHSVPPSTSEISSTSSVLSLSSLSSRRPSVHPSTTSSLSDLPNSASSSSVLVVDEEPGDVPEASKPLTRSDEQECHVDAVVRRSSADVAVIHRSSVDFDEDGGFNRSDNFTAAVRGASEPERCGPSAASVRPRESAAGSGSSRAVGATRPTAVNRRRRRVACGGRLKTGRWTAVGEPGNQARQRRKTVTNGADFPLGVGRSVDGNSRRYPSTKNLSSAVLRSAVSTADGRPGCTLATSDASDLYCCCRGAVPDSQCRCRLDRDIHRALRQANALIKKSSRHGNRQRRSGPVNGAKRTDNRSSTCEKQDWLRFSLLEQLLQQELSLQERPRHAEPTSQASAHVRQDSLTERRVERRSSDLSSNDLIQSFSPPTCQKPAAASSVKEDCLSPVPDKHFGQQTSEDQQHRQRPDAGVVASPVPYRLIGQTFGNSKNMPSRPVCPAFEVQTQTSLEDVATEEHTSTAGCHSPSYYRKRLPAEQLQRVIDGFVDSQWVDHFLQRLLNQELAGVTPALAGITPGVAVITSTVAGTTSTVAGTTSTVAGIASTVADR